MGIYNRCILPRLLDLAMRNRVLDLYRERTIAAARGAVLEIGVGSGLNLPRYRAAVESVCGIDPSGELLALAARRKPTHPAVSLVCASAERLPFDGASFDTVVTTWSLCSIGEPLAALSEMRRVLRPGGSLRFVEHGRAPGPGVARWQARLTPCWKHLAGGCHLDRAIDELIGAAGFRMAELATGYMPGPRPWTFMYQGCALG